MIFNADDLGLTSGVTAGILEAMEQGLVTDASLLACGEAFDEAVAGLRRLGRGVGVHLTAVDRERPLADHGPTCTLTGPDGCFHTNRNALLARLLLGRGATLSQLAREWRAQVERVAATGLAITHLDSHQHLHLFPGLAELAVSLAKAYAIPFIRVPRFQGLRLDRPVSLAVNVLALRLAGLVDRAGIGRVGFAGLEASGRQDAPGLIRAIARSRHPVIELAFHPGHADQRTRSKYAHWGFHWSQELQALQQAAFQAQLTRLGVAAVSFAELAP